MGKKFKRIIIYILTAIIYIQIIQVNVNAFAKESNYLKCKISNPYKM